ncbi:hypothetical protein [Gimesia maris]|uniref:hypothetical protein n=1 Tax=Gimesia maris TaxID=122 RepID=UPI003A910A89
MRINSDEIKSLVFQTEDGSFSSAVKIIHLTTSKEFSCDEFKTQIENRHTAVCNLILDLCTDLEGVPVPDHVPFDQIKTIHPNTETEGNIRAILWNSEEQEWHYYIEVSGKQIAKRYLKTDLVAV